MSSLASELEAIFTGYAGATGTDRLEQATQALDALLASNTLNPTGDNTEFDHSPPDSPENLPNDLASPYKDFCNQWQILQMASTVLSDQDQAALSDEIRRLSANGLLNKHLVDKFQIMENRDFLALALHNAMSAWQMALVANWVLDDDGMKVLANGLWNKLFPHSDLATLVEALISRITFRYTSSLRQYRRDAMHHYPRVSESEFSQLDSGLWQDVINLPSGRESHQDIPFITPFTKQGDIEHSLYRHTLMPDLLDYMREVTPAISSNFQFAGEHRALLFGVPFVVQQVEEELFEQIKQAVTVVIRQWAEELETRSGSDPARALTILSRMWNYRRSPPARDCANPTENLIKGFTATIRNGFGHLKDINLAASQGSQLDPFDVAEKMVLFASVSNGQLDNLATAHNHYIAQLDNPADWDNEAFFQHFLAINRECDTSHIQAHFLIDKTRGCPAVPQIVRFHAIVFDLVLGFALHEFGEDNIRQAGNWFLETKTPPGFNRP